MDIQMIGDVLMFYSYGCLSCTLSVYDIQLQKTNYRCDFIQQIIIPQMVLIDWCAADLGNILNVSYIFLISVRWISG